jgi:hypothetical protein
MGYEDILNSFLQMAGKRMGNKLFLDKNGLCVLRNNTSGLAGGHEYVVELPKNSDVVYFYSPICKVPYECSEEFFEKVLELNLCGIQYNQATFGLDAKTQNIVISYTRSMEKLDEIAFLNILCNFIKTADRAVRDMERLVETLVENASLSEEDVSAEMEAYELSGDIRDPNLLEEGHRSRRSPVRPDKLRV